MKSHIKIFLGHTISPRLKHWAINEIQIPYCLMKFIKVAWNIVLCGTTVIVGDNMLYGIDETRLRNTNVRLFPGSTIEDLYLNICPLLRKSPTNIFLVIGRNNAKTDNSVQSYRKISEVKRVDFINYTHLYCHYFVTDKQI